MIAPLVVIVGLQSAWAAFACRADGRVRDRCCCPAPERSDRAPADGEPRIVARCCAVSIHARPEAPIAREVDRTVTVAPLVAVVSSIANPIVAPPPGRAPLVATLARPPPPAELYLDKHALLR